MNKKDYQEKVASITSEEQRKAVLVSAGVDVTGMTEKQVLDSLWEIKKEKREEHKRIEEQAGEQE